jgi:hypothetical protein
MKHIIGNNTGNENVQGKNSFFPVKADEKSRSNFFQPKLKVGPVDDSFEREADAMAEQIVGGGHSHSNVKSVSSEAIQRKCSHCEEEEKLQRKEQSREGSHVEAPASVSDAISRGGNSMDDSTKNFMENNFGYNFSHVKIHTDSASAKSAEAINAHAYTSGSNIVFNEGQYNPNSKEGKRLLAHELTHVVQQGKSSSIVQRDPKPEEKKKPACPTFPASGVKVIGPAAADLATILGQCSGNEVTVDSSQMLKQSNKAVKGASKNASAKASVSNVINNKVGIIVDTDPKSIGTTIGSFDHDCPGRQFITVGNILVQTKATGSGGGLDNCSAVLHEMEEAVKARSLGSKATGEDLFKQSHAQGTSVENAIRKDAGLPLRDQEKGRTAVLGNISDKEMLIIESTVFGKDKAAKTQLNVFVCTMVPQGGDNMACINEVKASHVVDGIVKFDTRDEAVDVFNKYASKFGFKPLTIKKKDEAPPKK